MTPDLLALDDDHFAAAWYGMSDADRAALAPGERAAGIRRYVQLSGGGRGLEERGPKLNGVTRVKGGVQAEVTPKAVPLPHVETASALLKREMPEPEKLCDPWCIEGLCIVSGRPKLGKTTLLRQKAAALAEGASLWGSLCERATVLFMSLEEGERLMRRKLELATFPEAALENIRLVYEWPRGAEGVELLDRYLAANPEVRLVAIDSLTKFRSVPDVRTPAFVADYEAVSLLHNMVKARPGLCIDVIHHTRKAKSDDPIDDISGTYGLTAACDSYWVMRRHEDGAVLHVGGRLWERDVSEYQLRRAAQRWEMVGEHTGLTSEQHFTLEAVKRSGGLSGSEYAKQLACSRQSAWDRLNAIVEKGVAVKREGVVYPP